MDILERWEGKTEDFNPYETSKRLLQSKCKHIDSDGVSTIVTNEGKRYCTKCGKTFGGETVWRD